MLSSLSHALMIMSRWPEVSAEKTHIWEEQECSSTFLMRTLPHPAQTDPPLKSTSSSAIYSATSNTKRAFHNLLHLLPQQTKTFSFFWARFYLIFTQCLRHIRRKKFPLHFPSVYVSGRCSVLELTLGDKSSWCFNRAIELYQQRIQWLTENSKKVIDFFLCLLSVIASVFVRTLSVASNRPPIYINQSEKRNFQTYRNEKPKHSCILGFKWHHPLSLSSAFLWVGFTLRNALPSLGKMGVTSSSKLTCHCSGDLPFPAHPAKSWDWLSLSQFRPITIANGVRYTNCLDPELVLTPGKDRGQHSWGE